MIIFIRREPLLWVLLGVFILFFIIGLQLGIKNASGPLGSVTVAIDPGHGGIDGGCGSGEYQEKSLNLQVGLEVEAFLRQSGVRTVMTRMTDTALDPIPRPGRHRRDLAERVQCFHRSRATTFVSIHCDWSSDRNRRGPSVFYRYRDSNSQRLAETLQEELNIAANQRRRAEPGNYYILKNAKPPGVIVEVGFLSHPEDRLRLKQPAYRSALAAAISRGVLRYIHSPE